MKEIRYGLRYAEEGFVALDHGSGGYPYPVAVAEAQFWHSKELRDDYAKVSKNYGFIPVTIEITATDE